MATATETKPASPMGKTTAVAGAATAPKPPVTGAQLATTARAGRKLVDPNETPEQAFKRLTEPRVTKALKALKLLQNLSRFKPSDAHRDKVFGTLRTAMLAAEASWKVQEAKAEAEGFKL